MITDPNSIFMQNFLDASIADDLTAFKEMLAPDFVAHLPGGLKNREEFIQHSSLYNAAFSDRQIKVQDLIANDQMVMAHIIWSGTQVSQFQGLPATGKRIQVRAYITECIRDRKSIEHKSLFDQLTLMRQLGLLPEPQTDQ